MSVAARTMISLEREPRAPITQLLLHLPMNQCKRCRVGRACAHSFRACWAWSHIGAQVLGRRSPTRSHLPATTHPASYLSHLGLCWPPCRSSLASARPGACVPQHSSFVAKFVIRIRMVRPHVVKQKPELCIGSCLRWHAWPAGGGGVASGSGTASTTPGRSRGRASVHPVSEHMGCEHPLHFACIASC